MTRTAHIDREGVFERDGLSTWYRVVGDIRDTGRRAPLVMVHGGPGATHDYLEPLAALARSNRACVFYDQVGCGRSSHHPEVPRGFWTIELFRRELDALIAHLGLSEYHLLGQSWGAMLALEHALERPSGLRSLVLANAMASVPRYEEEIAKLLAALPDGAGDVLVDHATGKRVDDVAFQSAIELYTRRYRLRLEDTPEPLSRTQAAIEADPTVWLAMAGSEFAISGAMVGWDVTSRLREIDRPVLLISGRHDELPPALVDDIHHEIPSAQVAIVEEASHMTHLEQPLQFLDTVEQFLDHCESEPT